MFVNMDVLLLMLGICVCFVRIKASTGDLTRCPSSLPRTPNLFAYSNTCIFLVHNEHSWDASRNICKQHGGDLVVIKDSAKQHFIEQALRQTGWDGKGIWIGATDKAVEGHWKWVTGESMHWGNWARDQGQSKGGFFFSSGSWEDCALIRLPEGFKWHDYPCGGLGYHYSSICEYDMILPTTTAMPPTSSVKTHSPTTKLPLTTQPSNTRKPSTTTNPPTTTKSPMASKPATTTKLPITTKPPSTTKLPTTKPSTTTKLPMPTKPSTTTKLPIMTKPSTTTKLPMTTKLSSTTKLPMTTKPSTTTKLPMTTKPSTTTKSAMTTKSPLTTAPLMTTKPTTKSNPPSTTQSTKVPVITTSAMITTTIAHTTKVSPGMTLTPFTKVQTTQSPVHITTPRATPVKQRTSSTASFNNPSTPAPRGTPLQNNNQNPTAKPLSQTGKQTKSKSYTGYIIGGCVAAVVAGVILVALVIVRRRRIFAARNRKYYGQTNPTYDLMHGNGTPINDTFHENSNPTYDMMHGSAGGADVEINDIYSSDIQFNYGESTS